jgi:hypothetical protein
MALVTAAGSGHDQRVGVDQREHTTRRQPEASNKGCPFGLESTPGCLHYQPVSAHSTKPGSEACRHERMIRISEHVWQRRCLRV